MADQMVSDLLTAGVGTLAGSSAQSYDKLAKELGSSYLTGLQTAFTRLALTVRQLQKNPKDSAPVYSEALRILVALRSTIKKSRVFLSRSWRPGSTPPRTPSSSRPWAGCGSWRT